MCSKHYKKNSQKNAAFWETMLNKYEGRYCELEEKECDLQNRLDVLEKTAPHKMLLYNMWRLMQNEPKHEYFCNSHRRNRSRSRDTYSRSRERFDSKIDSRERSRSPLQSTSPTDSYILKKRKNSSSTTNKIALQQYIRTLEEEKGELIRQKYTMENMIKDLEIQLAEMKNTQLQYNNQNNEEDNISISSMEFELMKTVQDLKERGIEMSKRIEIMEKREAIYLETLKQADEICAEIEIGYKQHCFQAEQNEAEMRDRLQRLKKREEFERNCCYGDNNHQNRDKKCKKQDQKHWSMFDPICSMLNRWN